MKTGFQDLLEKNDIRFMETEQKGFLKWNDHWKKEHSDVLFFGISIIKK